MLVKYIAKNDIAECPYLTDGKEYEVDDIIEIDGEGTFYMIDDDDDDSEGCPEPYPSSLFEIVEQKEMKTA